MRTGRWFSSIFAITAVGLLAGTAAAQTPTTGLVAAPSNLPYEMKELSEKIEVNAQGVATETVHFQLKANNAAAAQQIGQQPVGYSEALSDVDIVSAFTLKSDGRKITVAPSAIYTQLPQGSPQEPMFDDQRQKVVVFPDVEAGDAVDLTFARHDKRAALPGQFMLALAFSRLNALDNVDVTVIAPKSYPLYTEQQDMAFDRHESGTDVTYHWHYATQGVTAEPEAPLLIALDKSPRLFVSSLKDYDTLGRDFADLVAPAVKVTPKIQALAEQITSGVRDRRLQAQKLYEWVSRHIRYVGIEIGTGAIVPHDSDTILDNGYGDCKDHVVLYSALLKAKGIASDFVLINIGGAYDLPKTVDLGQLNHAITWLPEFKLYADTTAGVVPFGSLPFLEYGKTIVHAVASGNALRHIPPLQPGLATVSTKTTAKIDADGRFVGTSVITATGPFSALLRQVGLQIQSIGPERAAAAILQQANIEGTGNFSLAAPNELGPSYSITSNWSFGPYAYVIQGKRFAMPVGIALLGLPGDNLVGSLASTKSRPTDPYACYSGREEEDISVDAPPGRHYLQAPPDIALKTAHVAFNEHWSLSGDTQHMHRDFTSTVDMALCGGSLRTELAQTLDQVRATYSFGAALAPEGSRPMAALDNLRVADARSQAAIYGGTVRLTSDAAGPSSAPRDLIAMFSSPSAQANEQTWVYPSAEPEASSQASASGVGAGAARAFAVAIGGHGDDLRAERQLTAAIAANAQSAGLLEQRGHVRNRLGRYDDAAADFGAAAALASTPRQASRDLADRANAYWMARDFRPALTNYTDAIKRDPGNADAYSGRGRSELFAGRLQEAIGDLTKAVTLGQDPYAAIWLFMAETRAGRDARSDVAGLTAGWTFHAWPGQIVQNLIGKPSAVAWSDAVTPSSNKRTVCAQEFFRGEFALASGDKVTASDSFRAAQAAGSSECAEGIAAGIELGHLSH